MNAHRPFGHIPIGAMTKGTAPKTSWWADCPRAWFTARCWEEWDRMRRSPLATENGLESCIGRKRET